MNARAHSLRWLLPVLPWLAVLPAGAADEVDFADLPPLEPWLWSGALRAGGGYKDNVELSSRSPVRSGFARAEAEVFGWRLPEGGTEVQVFGAAVLTRYFARQADQDERQVFGRAEAKRDGGTGWLLAGSLEGFHLDQFLDLSATDAERISAKLRATGGVAAVALRRTSPGRGWVELKPAVKRDTYRDGVEDSWQPGARLAVGREWAERAEASLAVQAVHRDYDDRRQYSQRGLPLPGTHLKFRQQEAEARVAWRAGPDRRWRAASTLLWQRNRDNGPSYYDYDYLSWKQELQWQGPAWRCRLVGRVGRYDYARRPVSPAPNAPIWRKDEYSGEVRVERRLSPRWLVYAEGIGERSRATNPLASYRVFTGLMGVEWTP